MTEVELKPTGKALTMSSEKLNVVRTPGVCGGKPRLDGLRIRVQDVARAYEQEGLSPDEICDAFPPLTLAQVHAAMAYYYAHHDEILAEMKAEKERAEEFRQQHPEWVR